MTPLRAWCICVTHSPLFAWTVRDTMRGSSSRKATTLATDCQRRNVALSGRSLRWHDPDQVQRSATTPVALSAFSRRLPYYCPSVIPTLTRVGKEVNTTRRCAVGQFETCE